MRHPILWFFHDVVSAFEFNVTFYLVPVTTACMLALTAVISFVFRSRKPIVFVAASLLTVYAAFTLSRHVDLHWRLYDMAMRP